MNCPVHRDVMKKVRLDVYYCEMCGFDWLIHPYRSEAHGEKRVQLGGG